jgi:hypothetical protein
MPLSISTPGNSKDDFEQKGAQIERYLDDVVIEGSDQELFIASYLSGHFSLMVSRAELEKDWAHGGLNQLMLASLNAAFSQNELPDEEQKQVFFLWEKLAYTAA